MRGRFSALTTRGRAFVAAGVAACACAVALGQDNLMRVAVLLIVLPLLTCLVVARTHYRIAATRTVHPPRIPVGYQATVQLRLENAGRTPTGLLLLEDHVPYVLRTRPRFVLDRMAARWTRDVVYHVRPDVRGRLTIGPLSVRINDPFGLVDLTRPFRSTDTLTVTPAVVPLPRGRLAGEWSASGASRPRAVAAGGEEDATVREYRDGDDLRRVHWRSSARRGELMVRREEQPWQSQATVFVDNRTGAHRGAGPASSFEWAVSAAASIGVHLLNAGYGVVLTTAAGSTLSTMTRESGGAGAGEGLLLDALAGVDTTSGRGIEPVRTTASALYPGAFVALLGSLTVGDAEALTELCRNSSVAYAIVLDTPSWSTDTNRQPTHITEQSDRARQLLHERGWRVVDVRVGESIPNAWARLLHGDHQGSVQGADREGAAGTMPGTAPSAAPGRNSPDPANPGPANPGPANPGPANPDPTNTAVGGRS